MRFGQKMAGAHEFKEAVVGNVFGNLPSVMEAITESSSAMVRGDDWISEMVVALLFVLT